MAYRLGVDVGGTFTDLFLVSDGDEGGQFRVKTPSTPADPSQGVLNGVRRICTEAGIDVSDLRNILHGTTVATNAVLESKGARVGLITTQGFKQILHLARSQTPGPLAGWIIMIKPDPPASLADTREAVERMDARGNTLVPVDAEQVESIVRGLVESGVETLTVALINSYVNGAHEREIGEIVAPAMPFTAPRLDAVPPDYRLLVMPYNSPAALLGLPVVVAPCGFVDGLPVGLAITGRRREDGVPLAVAHAFQERTDWHLRSPVDSSLRKRLYTT